MMRNKIALPLLYVLVVLAPLAHIMDCAPLKAVAAATQASPAMKVFTSHDGYETFSPRFHLLWQEHGAQRQLTLTPAVYAQLAGPYNRRNAYGAALSYAPVLRANPHTRRMHEQVIQYALCEPAPVLRELGVERSRIDGAVTVQIEPRRQLDAQWQLVFEVTCHE